MKTYRHLVFDIDGTLIDTENAVLHSLQKALLREHIDMPLSQLRFSLGIPGWEALKRFDLPNRQETLDYWDACFRDFLDEIRPFDGIVELLKKLRERGVRLGVVTSKTRIELAQDFLALGLEPYFEVIVTADETVRHKPDGEPMLKYLELAQAQKKETIYIGDSGYDLDCARNAGCDSALAMWGRSDAPAAQPTWILNTVADVLAFAKEV